jgi:hypothetical protein
MAIVAFTITLATGFRSYEAERTGHGSSILADVPGAVVQELRSRGCQIPAKAPRNIIKGEFLKLGLTDWAALCSTKKGTSLLVFPGGSREQVAVLETHARGFSKWSIATTEQEALKALKASWGWRGPDSTPSIAILGSGGNAVETLDTRRPT